MAQGTLLSGVRKKPNLIDSVPTETPVILNFQHCSNTRVFVWGSPWFPAVLKAPAAAQGWVSKRSLLAVLGLMLEVEGSSSLKEEKLRKG